MKVRLSLAFLVLAAGLTANALPTFAAVDEAAAKALLKGNVA